MSKQYKYFIILNGFHVAAAGALSFFGILNLYAETGSLLIAGLAYAGIFLLYPFLLYFLAPYLGKLGTKKSMLLGNAFFLVSLLPAFLSLQKISFLALWMILWNLARVFFNSSWFYQRSMLTTVKHRGREIAWGTMIEIFVEAAIPLLSGLIAALYGMAGLVAVAAIFTLAEMYLIATQMPSYQFLFSGGLFRYMHISRIKHLLVIVGVNDAQNYLNFFWHLFIFILLGNSFAKTGSVIAISVLLGMLLSYLMGYFLDHHDRRTLLKYEAVINPLLWLLRFVTTSVLWLVPVDTVYKLNKYLKDESVGVVTTDMLLNTEHTEQLDEKIVVREIVANVVISLSVLLGLLLALLYGIKAPLLLAAVISVLFAFV